MTVGVMDELAEEATESTLHATGRSGPVRVDIPSGGYLRLVVLGEEDQPVDLTHYAATLLNMPVGRSAPAPDAVDFAKLEASDGVSFWRDDQEIPLQDALEDLSAGIVESLRLMLDRIDG
jgi:hypothetical protein